MFRASRRDANSKTTQAPIHMRMAGARCAIMITKRTVEGLTLQEFGLSLWIGASKLYDHCMISECHLNRAHPSRFTNRRRASGNIIYFY